jgi:3-hydroxyacyl-CoA dehydrogenase/3a,7a,12a-trihydroxy-5b-cholest-24-enoyl-CoA hydratase
LTDQADWNFRDRVVLVTGGSRGLGRAFAECFARHGARVVINSLGSIDDHKQGVSAAERTRRKIEAAGGSATIWTGSVSAAQELIDYCRQTYGRLDVVVHSAGIVRDRSFGKLTEQDWQEVYSVHLEAAFKLSQAAWPLFKAQHYGRLLFIGSSAGMYGNFGQANYGAMKMGLLGLAKTLAIEGDASDIHCNCVAPVAATRMNEKVLDEAHRQQLKVEAIAPLVAYLCHERCSENGSLFEAAGGWFSKVRFQRSLGAVLPAGACGIADVASRWDDITDFGQTEAPETVWESLAMAMERISS